MQMGLFRLAAKTCARLLRDLYDLWFGRGALDEQLVRKALVLEV